MTLTMRRCIKVLTEVLNWQIIRQLTGVVIRRYVNMHVEVTNEPESFDSGSKRSAKSTKSDWVTDREPGTQDNNDDVEADWWNVDAEDFERRIFGPINTVTT
jgi:hypothetical protein